MDLNFFKDVDTDSFWLTFWAMFGLFLTTIVSVLSYNAHLEDEIVAKLAREGHDKLELSCLYDPSFSGEMCKIIANDRLQKTITDAINDKKDESSK